MAGISYTQTVGDFISSTLQNTSEKISDNIGKKVWYLSKIMEKKEKEDGGNTIRRTIEYALNSTFQSYYGYDMVPIVAQETTTDTDWTWKELKANWVLSRREAELNRGKTKVRRLVGVKERSVTRAMREGMNGQLLNPTSFTSVGNSSKDLTPLSMLVSTAALTVGGISESTYAYWANQREAADSTNSTAQTGSAFVNELRSFSNTCGQNSDGFPDLGVWSKRTYERYVAVLDNKVRYSNVDSAKNGFRSVMCENMEVYWDQIVPHVTANTSTLIAYTAGGEDVNYFLNTEFLYMVVHSGTDMVQTPAVSHQVNGQEATSGAMLFMGEHVCTNRRAQGVLYGVAPASITITT